MNWIISVVGALISAAIASMFVMWIENWRKPRVTLNMDSPIDKSYTDRPAQKARFLRLNVCNIKMSRFLSWMSRSAAIRCNGLITFYHLNDGQNLFGRSMQTKWGRAQEPLPMIAQIGQHQIQILDPQRLLPVTYMDIYPGEEEPLDVAVKFDDEDNCYGWSYDSYFSKPPWRNPDWMINIGRYIIKAEIIYSGGRYVYIFRLINDVPMNAFRLENATPEDYKKIGLKSVKN